jgi:hypothetical protein
MPETTAKAATSSNPMGKGEGKGKAPPSNFMSFILNLAKASTPAASGGLSGALNTDVFPGPRLASDITTRTVLSTHPRVVLYDDWPVRTSNRFPRLFLISRRILPILMDLL